MRYELLAVLKQKSYRLLRLSFLDTDPRLLEKQEQQQPTYVALSYINR